MGWRCHVIQKSRGIGSFFVFFLIFPKRQKTAKNYSLPWCFALEFITFALFGSLLLAIFFSVFESIRKLRILKLASCGGYRKLGISYFGGFKRGLITKTTIEFHPHGDVTVPSCGYQSDILCFDWGNQRIFYPGVLITVSNKHLKISKIIIVLIDLSTRFLKLEWFIAK